MKAQSKTKKDKCPAVSQFCCNDHWPTLAAEDILSYLRSTSSGRQRHFGLIQSSIGRAFCAEKTTDLFYSTSHHYSKRVPHLLKWSMTLVTIFSLTITVCYSYCKPLCFLYVHTARQLPTTLIIFIHHRRNNN